VDRESSVCGVDGGKLERQIIVRRNESFLNCILRTITDEKPKCSKRCQGEERRGRQKLIPRGVPRMGELLMLPRALHRSRSQ
jgi:hypothetical protein